MSLTPVGMRHVANAPSPCMGEGRISKCTGDGRRETGKGETGDGKTGTAEPGTGNREPGTGNREPGTGNREPGTGNRAGCHSERSRVSGAGEESLSSR